MAHLAAVPPERLAGLVCLRGSALSHVAILARAMGMPAVMGLGDRPMGRFEGCDIIVDGYQGRVYLNPDPATRQEYQQLITAEAELSAGLTQLRELPTTTRDGYRIPLYAKAGLLTDIATARDCGADGIGLYRTEFAFMVRESFPSEDEQCQIYRQMLAAFTPRPVIMRTLDIGGDKSLPYFTIEEKNPFLGWRGMRFTLDHPDIFLTQLRAMLRANADQNNLRILFPMITTVEEVDEALRLLEHAHRELEEDGWPAARPPVGVMIEVPSAAWQAEQLARRVDFLSVGTNDLTQYLLAVDRDNARVAGLYDNLHPAMLKTIAHIIASGRQTGRPVNLCGEMAADPGAAVLLLGMGVDSLSAGTVSVPRVKWAIRSFTLRGSPRTWRDRRWTLDTVGADPPTDQRCPPASWLGRDRARAGLSDPTPQTRSAGCGPRFVVAPLERDDTAAFRLTHQLSIAIRRGCAASRFGTITSSTPSLHLAATFSASATSGNENRRRKVPRTRSTRRYCLGFLLLLARPLALQGQHAILQRDVDILDLDARQVGMNHELGRLFLDVHRRHPVRQHMSGFLIAKPAGFKQAVDFPLQLIQQIQGFITHQSHGRSSSNFRFRRSRERLFGLD